MTLSVAIDRCMALLAPLTYIKKNHTRYAIASGVLTILISSFSYTPYLQLAASLALASSSLASSNSLT